MALTKIDLIEKINSQMEISKKDSADLVESVLSILKSTLGAGEKIKIAGFGNFEVKQKKDRRGRNPQTGETIIIDARKILTYKPSNLLKTRINEQSQ
ncbi:MAG TPA: integration host factor subunit alpha [Dongiaceae bacterium]|nr:integration host factor subunit alpha [Dongiaceae bacterium]